MLKVGAFTFNGFFKQFFSVGLQRATVLGLVWIVAFCRELIYASNLFLLLVRFGPTLLWMLQNAASRCEGG